MQDERDYLGEAIAAIINDTPSPHVYRHDFPVSGMAERVLIHSNGRWYEIKDVEINVERVDTFDYHGFKIASVVKGRPVDTMPAADKAISLWSVCKSCQKQVDVSWDDLDSIPEYCADCTVFNV